MSKLYGTLVSDTRGKPVTSGGHEEITAVLRYGSAGESIEAVSVSVIFNPSSGLFRLLVDVKGQDFARYALAEGEAVRHD